jgi:hypothetical protein
MEPEENVTAEAAEEEAAPITEEQSEVPENEPEETAGGESAQSTPDPEEPAKPRKKTAEERINELTRLRREAEREAEYWRNKAVQPPTPAPPTMQADLSRPKLENFETVESYEDALLAWHSYRNTARNEAEKRRQVQVESVKTFNEKADVLRKKHEDFDEAIAAPVFTPTMRAVLLNSEQGPSVAYYLGKPENAKIAGRIASLPPELQPYEIGKLETQLALAQKTRRVPGAPSPINPIGATGEASRIDESKLSDDDWYRLEQKRKIEKLKKSRGG